MVLGGLVGGWVGYWVGHALGLSTGAVWPTQIGGGAGAIVMSVGMAVLGVLVLGALIALPPYLTARRLQAGGDTVGTADATILSRWDLGLQANGIHLHLHLYAFLVETRNPDGSVQIGHVTQWLTREEYAALPTDQVVRVLVDRDHPSRMVVVPEPLAGGA